MFVNRIAVLNILNSWTQSLHTSVGIEVVHKILYLSQMSCCLVGVIPKSKWNKNHAGAEGVPSLEGSIFFTEHGSKSIFPFIGGICPDGKLFRTLI